MNTVKHSKKLNSRSLQKKLFSVNREDASAYISTMVFASWLATYLDLYFNGKKIYHFPIRPLPDIFSINIAFTLIGLPLLTFFYLYYSNRMTLMKRLGMIIIISLLMTIIEIQAEVMGVFIHSDQWKHYYSFFGYIFFLFIISKFYKWRRCSFI